MRAKLRTVKLTDYGDDWVNRLAQVEDAFGKMEQRERSATLNWLVSKYGNTK